MFIPKNLRVFEKSKALTMTVIEGSTGNPIVNLIKGWRVVSYQENLMVIKLIIEDPSSLSLSRVRLFKVISLGI
jgi:hypothetical protein